MHVQVVNAICATIVAIGLLLISTRLLQLASLSMEASRNPLRAGVLNGNGKASEAEAKAKVKPKKSICRACPNAKRLRDECVVEHGQDACTKWVEAHLRCLRAEGFKDPLGVGEVSYKSTRSQIPDCSRPIDFHFKAFI